MPLIERDESLWLVGDTIGTFVDSNLIRYPNNNLIGLKTDKITKLLGEKKEPDYPKIKDIIRNPPATIILWEDGTKTVVKCRKGERYDFEKGLAMCFSKKLFGNKGNYYNKFRDAMEIFEEIPKRRDTTDVTIMTENYRNVEKLRNKVNHSVLNIGAIEPTITFSGDECWELLCLLNDITTQMPKDNSQK